MDPSAIACTSLCIAKRYGIPPRQNMQDELAQEIGLLYDKGCRTFSTTPEDLAFCLAASIANRTPASKKVTEDIEFEILQYLLRHHTGNGRFSKEARIDWDIESP